MHVRKFAALFRPCQCGECRFGADKISKHRSHWSAPYCAIVLTLQLQAYGFTFAHADEATDPLYPGRYVAHCKPAPISGCICETDALGQVSTLSPVSSKTGDDVGHIEDIELRRLVEWLLLTCAAITQPRELR